MASASSTQKLTTPIPAAEAGRPIAAYEACHANVPSSSNIRSVLWKPTSSGENGWAPM